MMRGLILAAACLGLSGPAAATPPDVIAIEDSLFGISATHAFVLRQTSDNLGSHYSDRRETYLVAINLETGEEQLWPVYGATRTTDFGETGDDDRQVVTVDPRREMVDPYAVLEARTALPLSEYGGESYLELTDDAHTVRIVHPGGWRFTLSKAGSFARMESSLAGLAARMADLPRTGTMSTRQFYNDRTILPESCGYSAIAGFYSFYTERPAQLVRVTCHDGEEMEITSLIQSATFEASPASRD